MSNVKWISDPLHSELGFKIRHLMISNVSGFIKHFRVEVETLEEDFSKASILLTADMSTLSTNNEQRDKHLHSKDFFEVDNYPDLTFRSTNIEKINNEKFVLSGELTLKGITKPVVMDAEFNGIIRDPERGTKAGFTITGKINRSGWGVSFNRVLESGGVGLGEDVNIISEIQLAKQEATESIAI
ncbi:YceI family protein [Chitinophaga sp. CF418]|uniref:YceI family protein n=1 Tax=Chitinophaga sp. CF418 TaxID=1855287 RepID=UPI000915D73C|nr:YceI family protein [Chitinophaga sp. CF418]SHN22309.1 Polyisoprenoid-binding protein YceI [Chitinophaga sp. CF418]